MWFFISLTLKYIQKRIPETMSTTEVQPVENHTRLEQMT